MEGGKKMRVGERVGEGGEREEKEERKERRWERQGTPL